MLRKKRLTGGATAGAMAARVANANGVAPAPRDGLDRRQFLARSGLAIGGVGAAAALAKGGMVEPAHAQAAANAGDLQLVKTVCSHCSVGCSVIAEVRDGVWEGQEPAWDSPINMGAHCAKGAALREHAHGERRLKFPTKLVDGKWTRVSWKQAIDEIGDQMLAIREESGPDSVYWLGSAKHSNEGAYLFRKFASFWGTNNVDHQARICHSTTVAGVANTWGYGAMTNSYNDIANSKAIFVIGGNPAEAHPVSLLHILAAKEKNSAPLIVCDPRFTRTAAHADEYVRFRSGSDVALVYGILWHIFENGWEDKEFIEQRVWGMDQIREEVAKFDPAEVERITEVPGSQLERVARQLAEHKPGTVIWCMGGTQHTNGNNNTRAYCILQLALGNMGKAGGGTNIFRGHCNVQGATDLGVLSHTLPGYYGLSAGAWKHWSRVWDVDYDYLLGRFASEDLMGQKGIPVSRWIDGVLEEAENMDQPENVRAMVFWGHAPNSQTRLPDMRKAMGMLDLLVVVDPYPTVTAVLQDRTDGVYLLPATTQFETYGSITASNRSIQWREQVVDPLFEALPDHMILAMFAEKFGFADEYLKHIEVNRRTVASNGEEISVPEPLIEDVTREFNRGMWTVGYTGQSPERIRAHMANQQVFDKVTLQAKGGELDGDYYGMPWPCWGTPEMRHPGTPILYDPSMPVSKGGLTFRARFGVERDGDNLLAEGSWSSQSDIEDGYPEFTYAMLRALGWEGELTEEERASIIKVAGGDSEEEMDKINWKTDLSGGIQRVAIAHECAPYGNAKARCVVWNFPDPVPLHREPLYTPRRDLLPQYSTYEDRKDYRLPTAYASIQEIDYSKDFPIILTSGRLVEYEGGGDETRSNPWLAELQQQMFIEVNPREAASLGVRDGEMVWVTGPEGGKVRVAAMVTERVGPGVAFMPFHFGGHYQGDDLRAKYPTGADPYVLGESCNTAQTYGYDSVTQMQESKTTLCRIERAA